MRGEMSKEILIINYGGDNKIDAKLSSKLNDDIIKLIGLISEYYYPNEIFNINIKAFEKGSFEVIYEIVNQTLSDNNNIKFNSIIVFTAIVSSVAAIFSIIHHMKGKPIKNKKENNEKIIIKNQDNEEIEVDKKVFKMVLNNCNITNITNNYFDNLHKSDRTSVSVQDKNKKIYFTIVRKFFSKMFIKEDYIESINDNEDTIVQDTQFTKDRLEIVKIDFNNYLFYFNDGQTNIKCTIKDKEFIQNVNNGKQNFNKNDIYIVDRMQRKIFSENKRAKFEHCITKVHKIIKESKQLDFINE